MMRRPARTVRGCAWTLPPVSPPQPRAALPPRLNLPGRRERHLLPQRPRHRGGHSPQAKLPAVRGAKAVFLTFRTVRVRTPAYSDTVADGLRQWQALERCLFRDRLEMLRLI